MRLDGVGASLSSNGMDRSMPPLNRQSGKAPIDTSARNAPEAFKSRMTRIPYRRIRLPEASARGAVCLASGDADYFVGTTLFVADGMAHYPGFSGKD